MLTRNSVDTVNRSIQKWRQLKEITSLAKATTSLATATAPLATANTLLVTTPRATETTVDKMSTRGSEFELDFTKCLPQAYLPTFKQATSAYNQTLNSPPQHIFFRQKRKGIFVITTESKEDTNKLENAFVTYEYGPKKKFEAKVKLAKLPQYQFSTNAKNVYIDWTHDSGLRYATDADFDIWLSRYVTVIQGCTDDKDRETGFRNGRKKAYVDFNKSHEIERFVFIEVEVTLPCGAREQAKGKVKITYKDQPVYCKPCQQDHIGFCPKRSQEIAAQKLEEEVRQPLIKTLICADSNFRHVNQTATTAKVKVATGARIGHIANMIKHEEVEKFNHIVIHAGQNNITPHDEIIDQVKWEKQLKWEINQLKTHLENFEGTVRFIDVPESEMATDNDFAISQRDKINSVIHGLVDELPSAITINVSDNLDNETPSWVDYRHYSEMLCAKVLQEVDNTFPDEEKLLRIGIPSTTPKKYSKVIPTYRPGCGKCTKFGHSEEECPKHTGVKRVLSSGSSPPNAKMLKY